MPQTYFGITEEFQSFAFEVRISNYQKAKRALELLSNQQFYRGMFRDSLRKMLDDLRNYAESITHVRTGYLAGSHRTEYDTHLMRGWIYIDPRVAYSEGSTIRWPRIYGVYEHERGGSHAFYDRTVREAGRSSADSGIKFMIRYLDLRLPPSD